jgi:uncharacterized protein involved in exopolysaccharide biosynthesis
VDARATQGDGRVVSVAVQQDRIQGPNPRLALGLAIGVGILVFVIFLAVRRTFGVKH